MNDTDFLFEFIKSRESHCTKKLDIVSTNYVGGGAENYCLNNAENKGKELGLDLVSGWLSLPITFKESNWQKQFTQHWWNYDKKNDVHLDYSPSIEKGAIYIMDSNIIDFVNSRLYDLNSHVSSSIIYVNGYTYIIDYGESGYHVEEIDNLKNETIFKLKLKSNLP